MKQNSTFSPLLPLTGILAFLVVWFLLSYYQVVAPFFLPSPYQVATNIITLISSGTLLADSGISIARILAGFLLSVLISFPLGICLGVSKKTRLILEPLIAFVRYVPPSAFIPLVIVWFGIGELGKVALIFLGVAPYLTLLVTDSVMHVPTVFIESARMLGANDFTIIKKIIIPSSLPHIWDSGRVMFGAAWTFVIIAEIIGSRNGLGHLMIESQRFLHTDTIFAGIIVIGILGIVADYLFRIIGRKLFRWNATYSKS